MRQLFGIICLILVCFTLKAQETESLIRDTKHYRFQINYWLNMHHLLWTEAFLNEHLDSTIIDKELNDKEQEALDAALNYYRENLIQEDLSGGAYMTPFRVWIINQQEQIRQTPTQFQAHMKILSGFYSTYYQHFWPEHSRACKQVIRRNLELVKSTEEAFVEQITTLTRQPWQSGQIRVDVTFLGKISKRNLRGRPYTNLLPTHIVMNAPKDIGVDGTWLELLYVESARQLIRRNANFVSGTIQDVAEINKLEAPKPLWQAYLYFFAGKVTQDLLTQQGLEYPQIYMQRRGNFARYYTLLDNHLSPYLKREVTLSEVTLSLLQELAESKQND